MDYALRFASVIRGLLAFTIADRFCFSKVKVPPLECEQAIKEVIGAIFL